MSSEEKEPYFDGPLVTPPTGQTLFYPGGNPQPYGQMAHAAAPQLPPGPAFYNPNDFGAGAAAANPWDVPVPQESHQPHYNMNGTPVTSENAGLPGPQEYIGGVDSISSTSSSQHATPEHVQRQKLSDIPYNPVPHEPRQSSPHASSLFAPQPDSYGNQPASQMYAPVQPAPRFSPLEQNLQNSMLNPGEASTQPGLAHPPASGLFVPNSEMNNVGVQGYMNPVPHEAPSQLPHFTPNMETPNDLRPQIMEQEHAPEDTDFKNESSDLLNQMDLHYRPPAHSQATEGQSYMNMAYNHNCSGLPPPQGPDVRAHFGADFQVHPASMMIPASSGQDYDILHSQGTWEEQNNVWGRGQRQAERFASETEPRPAAFDQSEGALGAEGGVAATMDGQSVEDAAAVLVAKAIEVRREGVAAGDRAAEQHLQQNSENQARWFDVDGSSGDQASTPHDLVLSNQEPLSSGLQNENLALDPVIDGTEVIQEPNMRNHSEQSDSASTAQAEGQAAMLSLDYESGAASVELPAVKEPDIVDAYGPIPSSGNQDTELHESHGFNLDQGTVTLSRPDLSVHADQLPPASGTADHTEPQDAEKSDPAQQPAESPIPADGLHPRGLEASYSGSPLHQFASSPNSAFESRIRSQSIGSNNSNTSSQRLAAAQHPNIVASYPAVSAFEMNQTSRQDSVPTSNPFSTDTMHSSHVAGSPSDPRVSSAPPRNTVPSIPDIVRPSPGGSGDENLRTGSTTLPLFSSNQSLHSQVLRNRTAYPPEPPMTMPLSAGAGPSSSRLRPDLIQSPPEVANARPQTSTEVSHAVMTLKMSAAQPDVPDASLPFTSVSAPMNSDPYLSHSLHNAHPEIPVSSVANQEPVASLPPAQTSELERSPESSLPLSSARSDDLRLRSVDDGHNLSDLRRQNDDSGHRESSDRSRHSDVPRRDSRDSQWDEDRRRDEEYRRREYGRDADRYGTRWDAREGGYGPRWNTKEDGYGDERSYDDARSRHDHNSSRPDSRQSGYPDSSYSRYHDDRGYGRDRDYRERDPYYKDRDRYHGDYYPGYGRRDQYYAYDDRYYNSHQRWYNAGQDGRHYHDPYYYGSYYDDYRYSDRRRPEDEDSRSMLSERSRDPAWDREWHARHADNYSSRYPEHSAYYEDSLAGETTLSTVYDEWPSLPTVLSSRQTPAKFHTRHTIVRFGPGGQLIKAQSNRMVDSQPGGVEIHSLEILLQDTKEAEDLRSYPGPLSKDETHKNDVLQFASVRATESMRDMDLMDRRSTSLIWDFLALLVRQNGSVLGTDIAELLTKDLTGDFAVLQSPLEANRQRQLQHRTATPSSVSELVDHGGSSSPAPDQSEVKSTISSQSVDVASTMERNCHRFRELLLHGRKKDALEWAMKSGLWGHALLLASKTDGRTHAQVMLRFANSLPINDPLQTVYQLMSGRQPAAATCVSQEGWGDWRPHLAMILSNPTSSASLDMRAVLTMGDTLSTRGLLHAAHFCYLMSSTPLGYYGRPSSKMVLLGGNHTLPFTKFASWDSIRRTEIYEYAISLGKQQKSSSGATTLPTFQLYKFIYACKLAEYGLVAQAFHYCERIAKSVCRSPSSYSRTLVNSLVNVSDQLRHHDPQIQAGVSEAGNVRWLEMLRNISYQMKSGAIVPLSNVPPSSMTTSNTPSVISTSPTTDSQSDEIRFSAHTADLEENEEVVDSRIQNPQVPSNAYGQTMRQVHMYDAGGATGQQPVLIADTGLEPPATDLYSQGSSQAPPPHHPASYQVPGLYHQQQANFMQPSGQAYTQVPQVPAPMANMGQLANQSNPLASGFAPQGQPASGLYQQQSMYGGFNPEQAQNTPTEEAERNDRVDDYYDYMTSASKSQYGRSTSPRSRTISQSSQRSRASTIKGYDRTTPTAFMMNHADKQGRRSRTTSENSAGRRSRKTSGERSQQKIKPEETDESGVKKSGSWSIFGWITRRASKQVHLPDDKNNEIVWDEAKQRWVDKNASEEDNAPPAPPPMDSALPSVPVNNNARPLQPSNTNQNHTSSQPLSTASGEPQLTANRFSLKNLGGNRSMYKNAFSNSSKPVPAAPAPLGLLPGLQNPPALNLTGFMIPNPVPTSQPASVQDSVPDTTPMHPPDAAQAIQSAAMPPQSMSSGQGQENVVPGSTMFYNPSQFAAQPDLLSQPPPGPGRGSAFTRRGMGRPGLPDRR